MTCLKKVPSSTHFLSIYSCFISSHLFHPVSSILPSFLCFLMFYLPPYHLHLLSPIFLPLFLRSVPLFSPFFFLFLIPLPSTHSLPHFLVPIPSFFLYLFYPSMILHLVSPCIISYRSLLLSLPSPSSAADFVSSPSLPHLLYQCFSLVCHSYLP